MDRVPETRRDDLHHQNAAHRAEGQRPGRQATEVGLPDRRHLGCQPEHPRKAQRRTHPRFEHVAVVGPGQAIDPALFTAS